MILYRIDAWVSASMHRDEYSPIEHYYEYNLREVEYFVTKETPKGYWLKMMVNGHPIGYETKWMSKSANRRFAHATKKEAYQAFILRKKKYVRILKNHINTTTEFIERAERKLQESFV